MINRSIESHCAHLSLPCRCRRSASLRYPHTRAAETASIIGFEVLFVVTTAARTVGTIQSSLKSARANAQRQRRRRVESP